MRRGAIWWASLADGQGAGPGFRRPVVVVQADSFTQSRIATVIVAVISSNLRLAAAPGNVFIPGAESGLSKDSVINVSQLITIDKLIVAEYVGQVSAQTMVAVDDGIRLVLDG